MGVIDSFPTDVPFDGEVEHHFADGVYCHRMRLDAGKRVLKHVHDYDHLSLLLAGVAIVRTDEGVSTHRAPAVLTIRAGLAHEITAVEAIDWCCIHKDQ